MQTLTPYFQAVNSSMEGQAEKAVKISDSMVQLSESSSQTAASLREVNGAIAQLNKTAKTLQNEISGFKLDKKDENEGFVL